MSKSRVNKDISEERNRILTRRIHFEKAVFSISSLFIRDYNLDDSINQALGIIGKLTSADRVYLCRLHHRAKIFHVTHEWVNPDTGPFNNMTQSLATTEIGWLAKQLQSKDIVYIQDTAELPEQASNEKKFFKGLSIKSFTGYPVQIKEKREGFIGLDFIKRQNPIDFEDLEIIKIASDIIGCSIERKQIDKSLRKTEEMYQRIYENTGAATVTLKADTTILMVNSEFERLIGIPKHGLEGKKRLLEFVDKKDQAIIKRYHYLLISNPDAVPKNYEFNYFNIEGESRYAYLTGATLLDPKTFVLSFIDITEFKHVERQLRISIDKAEESDRLKSAFLANVSHEIRTPLNAITGFSALLAKPHLPPDKKTKYIKQILTGSTELVNLIDNVLDISRIESGTLKPKISEFLLNVRLAEILEYYNDFKIQQGKEKLNIRLNIPMGNDSLLVKTDPLRLQQILANLIENAIKFTSSGFVEFGYTILPSQFKDIHKDSVLFFVKDSGIGIAKKNKEKIFERFVKIVDKEGQIYRGSGLGLALARDLVHMLKGEIWVESVLGKGSTFYFTIPYPRPRVKETKDKTKTEKDRINLSDKTILIAEDTESNFLYLKEILSSTGIKLLRAKDGLEAIELFRKNKDTINLIFMDILMPEYDGFEASQRIREINENVTIIAQTAFTFEGELENGLYAGCFTDYLLKPFDLKTINKLLEKYLFKK